VLFGLEIDLQDLRYLKGSPASPSVGLKSNPTLWRELTVCVEEEAQSLLQH
jgi:hypothetical protein